MEVRRPDQWLIGLVALLVACAPANEAAPPIEQPVSETESAGSSTTFGLETPDSAAVDEEPGGTASAAEDSPATTESPVPTSATPPSIAPDTPASPIEPPESLDLERPDWLGTRQLPLRPDGFGVAAPTPPEMAPRRFPTIDGLPPPTSAEFSAVIGEVPADVLARSTWSEDCPVDLDELSYITMAHFGFDGRRHTGEMIVNGAVAEEIVGVFEQLFAAEFPIEEMRVIALSELDAPPTGDGNVTTAFVCRPAVGSSQWSQHAYGLAVDVNPFHNPYVKGDLVLPELASHYVDRDLGEPGMIGSSDDTVEAFAGIGWGWGGTWSTLKDWMHFSSTNT